ncbi:unnamed protein product [Symbiodinium sp. CCMP2456]|nr:unnamed protein product [Symbiodinium sp. CCMP2456]
MTFSFSEGILEYDTAATSVQRTACKKTLRDACRQIFTQDKRGKRRAAALAVKPSKPHKTKHVHDKKKIHRGRHLIFTLRHSNSALCQKREYVVCPLAPKVARQGRSSGPESFFETLPHAERFLKKGSHVAAVDGSRALHKCAEALQVPSAHGVAHLRKVFTPLSTIPKKGLDAATLKLLRDMCAGPAPTVAKETRDSFKLTGGDNVAESLAGVTKHELRRLSKHRGTVDRIEHRNILAAHWIHKNPGLSNVLRALKVHKDKCRGCRKPTDAFARPLWQD